VCEYEKDSACPGIKKIRLKYMLCVLTLKHSFIIYFSFFYQTGEHQFINTFNNLKLSSGFLILHHNSPHPQMALLHVYRDIDF